LQLREVRLLSRGAIRSASGRLKATPPVIVTGSADLVTQDLLCSERFVEATAKVFFYQGAVPVPKVSRANRTVYRREEPMRPFAIRKANSSQSLKGGASFAQRQEELFRDP
jgi:CRP-like cAMP-binding protein